MCLPTACCSRLRQTGAQLSRMDGSGLPRPGKERKHCFRPFRPSDLGFCPAVGTLLESQRAALERVWGLAEAVQGGFPQVPRPPEAPNGGGPRPTGPKFFFGSAPPGASRAADHSPPGTGAKPPGRVEVPGTLDQTAEDGSRPSRSGARRASPMVGQLWCRRGYLNPYALFGHQALNLARLPIPPLRRDTPVYVRGCCSGPAPRSARPRPVQGLRCDAAVRRAERSPDLRPYLLGSPLGQR